MALDTHDGSQLLLGRGEVYIDRLDANGVRTGEYLLGDCPAFTIGCSAETVEAYSSVVAAASLLKSVTIRGSGEVSIECRELQSDTVAIAFLGDKVTEAQSAGGPVPNEVLSTAAVANRWYQLGGDATPRRNVTGVTVEPSPSGTAYILNTDYKLDAVRGRVGVIATGAMVGDAIQADYSYSAISTGDRIKLLTSTTIEAFVRFIGKPAAGPVWEAELWKVALTPEGILGFIGSDFISFTIKGKLLDASTNHATDPYGVLHRISG